MNVIVMGVHILLQPIPTNPIAICLSKRELRDALRLTTHRYLSQQYKLFQLSIIDFPMSR